MKRYGTRLILMVASLVLITTGWAFAHDQKISKEGKLVIHTSQAAMNAVSNFNDQRTDLGKIGTEAGAEVVASPKAQLAAKLYSYDHPEAFAKISDEAGTSYFAGQHQSSMVHDAIANFGKEGTICLTC